MNSENSFFSTLTVKIINSLGFHARTSAELSHYANKFKQNDIMLINTSWIDSEIVNAKSLFGILTMAVNFGENIKIEVKGRDAQNVAIGVKEFIEKNFFEIDCPTQLVQWLKKYKEKDPLRLAHILNQGNPEKNEPNDLYFWSKSLELPDAHLIISNILMSSISEQFIIPNDILYTHTKDIELYRFLNSKSSDTIYIEGNEYTLLKFGLKDLNIFRDAIIEIVKGYRNE